jgi:hypothetical protein
MPRQRRMKFVEATKIDDSFAASRGMFLRGENALGTHTIKRVWIHQGKWGKRVVLEVEKGLLTLNKLSVRNLLDEFGPYPKDWIGKRIRVRTEKVTVGGVTRDVLLAEPVDHE